MKDILCPTCGRPNSDNQEFCNYCYTQLGPDESSRLDDLLQPEETSDESSRLDDLLQPQETSDESSRLDDLLPPEETPDESSRLDDLLPPEETPDEISRLDDLVQPEETPGESSRLDDLLPPEEIPDESSRLDDLLQPEESSYKTPPSDGIFTSEETPDHSTMPDDQAQPDVSSDETPPADDYFTAEETSDDTSPLDNLSAPEDTQADSTLPDDRVLPDETPEADLIQQTEPLDEFDLEQMSPGFGEDAGWFDMLQDPDSTEESEPKVVPTPTEKKSETDWLERIKRLNKSSEEIEDDSSFPDWLSVTGKKEQEPTEKSEETETPAEEVPDWLQMDEDDTAMREFLRKKDLTDVEITPEIPEEITVVAEAKEEKEPSIPDKEKVDTEHKQFPSWASAEDKPSPEGIQDIPEELQFLAGISPDSTPRKTVDPFQIEEEDFFDDLFDDELPSWLSSASSGDEPLPIEHGITPGELPGWVEAMRPVVESTDTTGLPDDEDYIENYGPLAGIPSVLPAEAELALDPEKAARKPLDLTASKSHQEYVNLLRKIIGEESKLKVIKKPPPLGTQRVLRWLIAIILLVTITATIIFGDSIQTPTPTDGPIQTSSYGALYYQIERLKSEQPVLIAFDYQPAATGEMHTASAAVIDHLMEQGTYLSFVSTQPTGPVLAEHFLATTQGENAYKHNQQYINLGYLPGESAGLLSFVIAPKKIIPLAFDGSNAWGSPPLINVNDIGDFEMILVITDDPNTAKIWIEQVGTILKDTPLNMVVSAQVEPLIQPYFRSSPQLLSGYVSGVIDSMKYESLMGQPNLANKIWLPFNIGIIITVGTIFIGGLANGVMSLFSRHRARQIGVRL